MSEALTFLGLNEKGEKLSKDKVFIIKDVENRLVGECWLDYLGEDIILSYWIGKLFQGKGYAVNIAKTVLKNFYKDKITIPLCIGIQPINDKSLGVLKRIIHSLSFKDFAINKDIENGFESPKHKLVQTTYTLSEKFNIDHENPGLVVVSVYISGQKVDEFKKIKSLLIVNV